MSMQTLDSVVKNYLNRIGAEGIDNRYYRFLQIAIYGLRDLKQDNPSAVNFAFLPVEENSTVTLPEDYIQFRKVGACINGTILGLAAAPDMCPPGTDSCGDLVVDQPAIPDTTITDGIFWSWQDGWGDDWGSKGRMYGLGGGQNIIGKFKIFPDKGYIALQSLATNITELVLEYDADISKVDGKYMCHQYEAQAIMSWIAWQSIIDSRTYSLGEKEMRKRQYNSDKKATLSKQNRFQMNELMQALRAGYKSSPKI